MFIYKITQKLLLVQMFIMKQQTICSMLLQWEETAGLDLQTQIEKRVGDKTDSPLDKVMRKCLELI